MLTMLAGPFIVYKSSPVEVLSINHNVKQSQDNKEEGSNSIIKEPKENTSKNNNENKKIYSNYKIDKLKILDETTGEIIKISMYDYVVGAVMSEMPATYNAEALKAQAVAAHTYAVRLVENQKKFPNESLKGADFKADPSNYMGFMTKEIAQKRFGDNYDLYYKKISSAVDQVSDEIMIYNNEPIVAAYHAISGGKTEDASNVWEGGADYLVPVESVGDRLSPGYETNYTFASSELKTLLENNFENIILDKNPEKWIEILEISDSGYITKIKLGNIETSGLEFRNALGLRSSNFEYSYKDNVFSFDVLGYGHGVGLSQYGSDYLARQGKTYQEILQHYYKDIEIVRVK